MNKILKEVLEKKALGTGWGSTGIAGVQAFKGLPNNKGTNTTPSGWNVKKTFPSTQFHPPKPIQPPVINHALTQIANKDYTPPIQRPTYTPPPLPTPTPVTAPPVKLPPSVMNPPATPPMKPPQLPQPIPNMDMNNPKSLGATMGAAGIGGNQSDDLGLQLQDIPPAPKPPVPAKPTPAPDYNKQREEEQGYKDERSREQNEIQMQTQEHQMDNAETTAYNDPAPSGSDPITPDPKGEFDFEDGQPDNRYKETTEDMTYGPSETNPNKRVTWDELYPDQGYQPAFKNDGNVQFVGGDSGIDPSTLEPGKSVYDLDTNTLYGKTKESHPSQEGLDDTIPYAGREVVNTGENNTTYTDHYKSRRKHHRQQFNRERKLIDNDEENRRLGIGKYKDDPAYEPGEEQTPNTEGDEMMDQQDRQVEEQVDPETAARKKREAAAAKKKAERDAIVNNYENLDPSDNSMEAQKARAFYDNMIKREGKEKAEKDRNAAIDEKYKPSGPRKKTKYQEEEDLARDTFSDDPTIARDAQRRLQKKRTDIRDLGTDPDGRSVVGRINRDKGNKDLNAPVSIAEANADKKRYEPTDSEGGARSNTSTYAGNPEVIPTGYGDKADRNDARRGDVTVGKTTEDLKKGYSMSRSRGKTIYRDKKGDIVDKEVALNGSDKNDDKA